MVAPCASPSASQDGYKKALPQGRAKYELPNALDDLDFLYGVLFDLGEAHGEDAVF